MSLLKADTLKPVTSGGDLSLQGDSGGSAVDCLNITSAGDINFTGNTDAKIKLPSAGGIYESDGSTAILTEAGGAVTLENAKIKLPSAGGIYESDGSTAILTEAGGAVTLENVDIKALINAGGSAPIFACRASGAVDTCGGTAYALQNLSHADASSVHTFTFTTAPADAEYTVVVAPFRNGGYNEMVCVTTKTASAFTVTISSAPSAGLSPYGCNVAVFF